MCMYACRTGCYAMEKNCTFFCNAPFLKFNLIHIYFKAHLFSSSFFSAKFLQLKKFQSPVQNVSFHCDD